MNPSVSTIADFIHCPLCYKLKHIVGLRKIEDESAEHHLRFGAAWHRAMEVIYRSQIGKKSRDILLASTVKEAKEAFAAAYPEQLDLSDNAKTQESGIYAIQSYLMKYALEDQKRWRVVAVESPETYDDGFITHLDMVAENLEYGGYYGFDFKTTKKQLHGKEGAQFWRRFEPSSQITRYVDFIRSKYGSCEGFYIRATSFTYSSKNTKLGPAGFRVNHEAQLFNVSDEQMEMERESSRYWRTQIAFSTEHDVWGMNTDHCQWCTYRPICRNGWTWEQDAQNILINYRLICNELTANLRACALEPGHAGEHSEQAATVGEFSIEVEI